MKKTNYKCKKGFEVGSRTGEEKCPTCKLRKKCKQFYECRASAEAVSIVSRVFG